MVFVGHCVRWVGLWWGRVAAWRGWLRGCESAVECVGWVGLRSLWFLCRWRIKMRVVHVDLSVRNDDEEMKVSPIMKTWMGLFVFFLARKDANGIRWWVEMEGLMAECSALGRVKDGRLMVMKRFLKDDGFKILTFPVFFLFYAGLLRKKDEEDGYEDCMTTEVNARSCSVVLLAVYAVMLRW